MHVLMRNALTRFVIEGLTMDKKLRDRVLHQILKNQQLQLRYGAMAANHFTVMDAEKETTKLLKEIDESTNVDRSGERTWA